MEKQKRTISEQKKSCINCGAELTYKPGTHMTTCDYCGHKEEISPSEIGFEELELKPYLNEMGSQSHSEEITMLHCKNCGANQHIEENYKSLHCVYCTMPLIVEDTYTEDWILPGAILPFQFDQKKSHQIFMNWVKDLWFAPNNLKKAALDPQYTKGLYLPYWTFDAQLYASYTGQRGTYYYVTVPYTTTVNGKTVTKTRSERRTRWSSTKGTITGFIDDTLISASNQHRNQIPAKITNWKLDALEPFNSSFLAGFITEKYTISLKDGHLQSNKEAKKIATSWAKRDIGGDEQRVHNINMNLSEETFKHILLPVYVSSYQYSGTKYNFFINGQTGTISGKRPYSFWKIFFFVLFIILVIGVLVVFFQ
ncbi:DNA helicase PriA [Aquimarina hainanensis]|uniref:DNA helicase PriA n=1 Tax=Aquimarina hainanensis TaxID=1578017 RepID=A0ABW5N4D6_9FLAO